jgi:sporulation protein YlmC with PRC-barrel domain
MNDRKTSVILTAMLLALAAGSHSPVLAQPETKQTKVATKVASTVDFRSSKWMSDRTVVNNNGEDIANVSDLILDRGTGRIEYVVVKTGTTFGLGGRAIAVPFGSFAWEAAGGKDRFILGQTIEQLKQYAEYTPETWKALREAAKDDKSVLRQRLDTDGISASDPYAGNLDAAKQSTVTGEITNVERVRTSKFGEQVQITVETAQGAKKVTLGPSWYVNGSAAAPMRGDKVVVETVALPRDADSLLAGTHIHIGKNELHLRDTNGSPAWALKQVDAGGKTYSSLYSRYLLLSDLPGMKIDCRGNECGKVYDIILDRTSGEIGFLSIDPNQNFLGISDTKRMVPWSIALVMLDGTMRIDASKEMVLASPETPSDLSTLNTGTHAERVYKAFAVPAPKFEMRKPAGTNPSEGGGAWSARGAILSGIEHGSAKTLEGTIVGSTEVDFGKEIKSARAIKIRTGGENGAEELVLLGPAWYMDNQKPAYKSGESIKIEACRTTIEGRQYWIAKSFACNERSVVLIDSDNAPSWGNP